MVLCQDKAGNLKTLGTKVRPQGKVAGYTQTHQYSYELWDSYQQATDTATLSIEGQATTNGLSERHYDVNGQLKEAVDSKADANGANNTTQYLASSIDGIRARSDKVGQTSYLTVGGKTIGDLRLDSNKVQHLDVYGGFTPNGTPEQSAPLFQHKHHKSGTERQTDFLKREAETNAGTIPDAPQDNLGAYTLQAGDTLESIALQVYGDSSLWYLIADANGITERGAHAGEKDSQLHLGQRLNIPPAAGYQHHTNATHKVMNGNDVIGNTSATTPLPPAPPPPQNNHSFFKTMLHIVVAVVAVVVTVMSAGALAILAGAVSGSTNALGLMAAGSTLLTGGATTTAASLGIGFAAGFIGSVASQGAANAFNLQHGMDMKGALISGLATAATAGVTHALKANDTYAALTEAMDKSPLKSFSIKSATTMMETDAITQSLNMAIRGHQHFDWLELGVNATTAGVMGGSHGQKVNQTLSQIDQGTGILSSELQSLTKGATTSAANGTHFNAAQVLTDNLGNAIGSGLVQVGGNMDSAAWNNDIDDNELGQYCPIPNEDGGYSPIPDGTYQRFHAEAASRAWNDDDSLAYDLKLYKSWDGGVENRTFEDKVFWGSRHGVNDPALSLDATGLVVPDTVTAMYKSFASDVAKIGKYDIDYESLFVKNPGSTYRKDQIVTESYYNRSPGSPIWGDANKLIQTGAIDALIASSIKNRLDERDTAYVLAIAQYESGFNPYSAAGTTTASGLGQFIDKTGKEYGINDSTRWDMSSQAEALVLHFVDNKARANRRNLSESYIYKFHHDGPSGEYGGLNLSNKYVIPQIRGITKVIHKLF